MQLIWFHPVYRTVVIVSPDDVAEQPREVASLVAE
jgi:hypothetical protein